MKIFLHQLNLNVEINKKFNHINCYIFNSHKKVIFTKTWEYYNNGLVLKFRAGKCNMRLRQSCILICS